MERAAGRPHARISTSSTSRSTGLLADHGVLPEIKAALRARSEHRPHDDRDLLRDVHANAARAPSSRSRPTSSCRRCCRSPTRRRRCLSRQAPRRRAAVALAPASPQMVSADILAGLAALAAIGRQCSAGAGTATPAGASAAATPGGGPSAADGLPEPRSADGARHVDAAVRHAGALAEARPARRDRASGAAARRTATAGAVVPLNLIPHIRAAIDARSRNPTDRISMDVIALLFDYIFRDPSIPESTRSAVRAPAGADRQGGAARPHVLLGQEAPGAAAARPPGRRGGRRRERPAYRAQFEAVAQKAIDRVCADFEIDVVGVPRRRPRSCWRSSDEERQQSRGRAGRRRGPGAARRGGRSRPRRGARAAARPPRRSRHSVRGALVRRDHLGRLPGGTAPRTRRRQRRRGTRRWSTLDDMLWSIVAKERTRAEGAADEDDPVADRRPARRLQGAAASRRSGRRPSSRRSTSCTWPRSSRARRPPRPATSARRRRSECAAVDAKPRNAAPPRRRPSTSTTTWARWPSARGCAFDLPKGAVDARLTWVSPLRAKYIFTSRSRSHAFMLTPEELAYAVGQRRGALVVEPVPLWDRAVSSALDTLAARRPPSGTGPAVPAPAMA